MRLRNPPRNALALAAWIALVAGVALSIVASSQWSQSVDRQEKTAFDKTSSDIATSISVTLDPQMSNKNSQSGTG